MYLRAMARTFELTMPTSHQASAIARVDVECDLTFTVADMSCEHCKLALGERLTLVAGVRSVEVDLETEQVRVRGTDVDVEAVIAGAHDAGYRAVRA